MEELTDTERLQIAIHTDPVVSIMPESFIDAIRFALQSGFSSNQIVAIVLLASNIITIEGVGEEELVGRVNEVSTVIRNLREFETKSK